MEGTLSFCYTDLMTRERTALFSPTRVALLLSLSYMILCAGYIFISTTWAARHADSLDTMARIEQWKGVLFILVTAILFYGFALVVLKKIRRQADLLHEQEMAMLKSDRLNLAGAMAMSVAHDMSNQISVLSMGLEELRPQLPPACAETAHCLGVAVEQLGSLSRQLLATGQQRRDSELAEVDLRAVVECSVNMVELHPRAASCALVISMPEHMPARVIQSLITHMLMNAVINAADATAGKGRIEIRGSLNNGTITLEVHDNGPGIPEQQRAAVTSPFYTTKSHGHGLGFLSIDYCARMHEGQFTLDQSDMGGCCVRVRFPQGNVPH